MDDDENQKITYYACFLLNDGNAKEVPASLIPKITVVLSVAKKKAITKGQINNVKQIQQILANLDNLKGKTTSGNSPSSKHPYTNHSSTTSPSRKSDHRSKSSQLKINLPPIQKKQNTTPTIDISDEELDLILEDLVNGRTTEVDVDVLPSLIGYTKIKIKDLIGCDELITAQKYEDVYQQLISFRHLQNSKVNKKSDLTAQLERAVSRLDELQNKMQQDLENFDANMRQLREYSENEWQQQLRDFDDQTYGELPSNYKRFSQKLLNLREQAKYMVKTRRFEEAGFLKLEADELEQYELGLCREKYIQTRERQKINLIDAHNQKMKCFEDNCQRNRLRIMNESQNQINCIERAITNLQNKLESLPEDDQTLPIETPVPTPLPSTPMSPHRAKSSMFVTQHGTDRSKMVTPKSTARKDPNSDLRPKSKVGTRTPSNQMQPMKYRPISSKWRFQNPPIIMKAGKKNVF